jgi:hypothetical protein
MSLVGGKPNLSISRPRRCLLPNLLNHFLDGRARFGRRLGF